MQTAPSHPPVAGPDAIARFTQSLLAPAFVERIADRLAWDSERTRTMLAGNAARLPVTLEALAEVELDGRRILEVGAGPAVVSLFLAWLGHDVTAVEPATSGFDFYDVVNDEARKLWPDLPLTFLRMGAGDLDPRLHGRFDVIFSINVLEHIPELDQAFAAMAAVLADGGVMLHECPNYAFPYEPHFGVLLLPFVPRCTATLLPPAIRDSELWRSLNFITFGRARRLCRNAGLQARFAPGLMRDQLIRLAKDDTFVARHKGGALGWIVGLARGSWASALAGLLIPARLASPMRFVARRALERRQS